MNNKQQIIDTLTWVRNTWRRLPEADRPGFKLAFTIMASGIEFAIPESETWTCLPDEADLNDRSRLGDHLSVTQRLMGLVP